MSRNLNAKLLLPLAVVFVMVSGAFVSFAPSISTNPAVQKSLGSGVRDDAVAGTDAVSAAGPTEVPPAVTDYTRNPGKVDAAPISDVPNGMIGLKQATLPSIEGMTAAEKLAYAQSQGSVNEAAPKTVGGMDTQGNLEVTADLASFDAGGPYGGPTTYEGDSVTFHATQSGSPVLVLIRWDFNGDGKWDKTPTAVGCPATCWSTDFTANFVYPDNYYGQIVKAEAWDTVSFTTVSVSGSNFGSTTPAWYGFVYGYYNLGWRFQAKQTASVNVLRAFEWWYGGYYMDPIAMGLWSDTGTLLRSCTLSGGNVVWQECAVAPITITAGTHYRIATEMYGYWLGNANGEVPSSQPEVTFEGSYYNYAGSPSLVFPQYLLTNSYLTSVDFKWSYSLTTPAVLSDTAFVDVRNAPPVVFDAKVAPAVGQEGTPVSLTAKFTDPGTKDSWWYRVDWGDGTVTDWTPIGLLQGQGDVLYLHSLGPYNNQGIAAMKAACSDFCTSFDVWDFGPLGKGSLPSLAKMMEYDVIVLATNYFVSTATMVTLGNRLADFEDITGGGVVMMAATAWGNDNAGIGGRFDTQNYSPVPRNYFAYGTVTMGTVYDPDALALLGVGASTGTLFYSHDVTGVRAGATQIADYTNGRTFVAQRTNPIVANGALTIFVNFFPPKYIDEYFGIMGYGNTGDDITLVDNAIRLAGRAHLAAMPITLTAKHVYADDHPATTTSQDTFNVVVQVKDDDHGKLLGGSYSYSTGFPTAGSFPAGWTEPAGGAWVNDYQSYLAAPSPNVWFFYCDPYTGLDCRMQDQTLRSPSFDLSAASGDVVSITYQTFDYWYANYPCSNPWADPNTGLDTVCQEGWIEASTDGFATSVELEHWWSYNPSSFYGTVTHDLSWAAGSSNLQIQYRIWMYDDWWWNFDDFSLDATWGSLINGLGEDSTTATIANVAPTATGGPTSGLVQEATAFHFEGYSISDPALYAPTELFAFRWDLDDGTVTPWTVLGAIEPAKILLLNTLCYPGPTCAESDALRDMIVDGVQSAGYAPPIVTQWSWFTSPPTAPSLAYLLQFDAVVVTTNWAWIGGPDYAPFVTARTLIGDRLATYLDITGKGVVGLFGPLDLSGFYGAAFAIEGRMISDEYFFGSQDVYGFSPGTLGEIFEPDHPVMQGVNSLQSPFIHNSDHTVSVSGGGGAAGHAGEVLADWNDDANAIGVKQLDNGRTAIVPSYVGAGGQSYGDLDKALANSLIWTSGGFDSPRIPSVVHTYGDNGIYRADLQLVDDDMGYALDVATQTVTAVDGFTPVISHNVVPVEVENVDPVITNVRASFVGDLCLRLTGNSGNSLTMEVNDGTSTHSLTLVRDGNNPEVACLTNLDIDVRAGAGASIRLIYDPADDNGANPSWIMEASGPGASTHIAKEDFNSKDGPQVREISFGTILLGMPITFRVDAGDVGSDNLGVVWDWGDSTPMGIQAHEVGSPATLCGGANKPISTVFGADSIFTGCDDPTFERGLNSIRSPSVKTVSINDVQTHKFTQNYLYYVMVLVPDDDNTEHYPSTFLTDGVDMEFVLLDFTA